MQSAATLVREARLRAGLTQTELAVQAGIAQSVVSMYEASRREPSFEMLQKLVAAAGFELDAQLSPARSTVSVRDRVHANRRRLAQSLRELGASDVRLFGSVARGDDGPDSDIDLLIDLEKPVGLFALGRMRSEAERILGRSVDIVPSNSLKPDVAERVLAEAVPL